MERNQEIAAEIGQRIAFLRKEAGLSQAVLAERSGIRQSHLSRIECGKYNITLDVLNAIAKGLGRTIDFVELDANG